MVFSASFKHIYRAIFVMFGVSVVVFGLLQIAPGDVTAALLGPQASEAARETLREQLGLNKPLVVQYGVWFSSVVEGDFGTSAVTRNPVLDEVIPRALNSIVLASAALVVAVVLGVVVGIAAAAMPGSLFDRVASAGVQIFGAIPPFWMGLVLVYFFSLQFRIFPAIGMTKIFGGGDFWDIAEHLVLPAITAGAASSAVIVRMVRAVFIEALSSDYIVVARARGVRTARILLTHALPNCLPHILNIIGLQLGYLIGGVLFTEVVFAWPGIGQLLYRAILGRDIAVVQACVLFIAITFVLINMGVDLINGFLAAKTRQS